MSPILFIAGPRLARRVRDTCFQTRVDTNLAGHASYKYVDVENKVVPEYAATHIRITAFYFQMSVPMLDKLEAELTAMDGCISTTRIERHPSLRPQIIAIFDRERAF